MWNWAEFVVSIIPSSQAICKLSLIIFIYRWGNWNLEQLSELLSKIVNGKTDFEPRPVWLQSTYFIPLYYTS